MSIHRIITERVNELLLQRDERIVISEGASRKLKDELLRHGGFRSNENKMSDGGRERASFGVEVWKSSQRSTVRRSAVRSIAWLDR